MWLSNSSDFDLQRDTAQAKMNSIFIYLFILAFASQIS